MISSRPSILPLAALEPATVERSQINIELAHALPKRVHIREELGGPPTQVLAFPH
jgi:hypothetical protein